MTFQITWVYAILTFVATTLPILNGYTQDVKKPETPNKNDTTALHGVLVLKDDLDDPQFNTYHIRNRQPRLIKLRTAFGIIPIQPYALSEQAGQVIFRCISKTKDYYKVVCHEEKNELCLIKIDDPNFEFEDWETHIEHAAQIEALQPTPSPLHPDTLSSDTINYDKSHNLLPLEIENDWLKVTWVESQGGIAWLRWRNKSGTPLIRLYYHY
jgi:hypothetical protein